MKNLKFKIVKNYIIKVSVIELLLFFISIICWVFSEKLTAVQFCDCFFLIGASAIIIGVFFLRGSWQNRDILLLHSLRLPTSLTMEERAQMAIDYSARSYFSFFILFISGLLNILIGFFVYKLFS